MFKPDCLLTGSVGTNWQLLIWYLTLLIRPTSSADISAAEMFAEK